MKHSSKFLTLTLGATIFAMGSLLSSCTKSADDALSSETTATVNNESAQDAQQDEVDDIATNQMATVDAPGGRINKNFFYNDARCACATITHVLDTIKGSGSITIDFGTGCQDKNGNTRAGKIMINWTGGRWYTLNSVHVITFSGYSINQVKFSDQDIRTVTNVNTADKPLFWNIVATHSLTWPDNTIAKRTVYKSREWVRSSTVVGDTIIISQTSSSNPAAVGINRHGVSYSTAITSPLEYFRACAISSRVYKPVIGTKVITYDNGKVATIDFGTGTCDNTFTVSADGKTKTFNAKNDASND